MNPQPNNNNGQQQQQPQSQQQGQPQAAVNPFAMMGGMNPFLMQQMGAMRQPQQQQQNVQPAILYRDQLSQLNAMGFNDAEANIQALIATVVMFKLQSIDFS